MDILFILYPLQLNKIIIKIQFFSNSFFYALNKKNEMGFT